MGPRIADSLVLVFTPGISLKVWRDTGMIDREWALYERLLAHYGKIVVVSYGGAEDEAILRTLPGDASRLAIVHNAARAPSLEYADSIPSRVLTALDGSSTVVVKTNQMAGGETAVRIVEAVRHAGKRAGLIARGGYLWSRFVTHEHGPHSDAADDASERERLLCQAADMVVGTTADMVEDLSWRYGLNPGRTKVIPNYILAEGDAVPACMREPGLLLYAGQLVRRKHVEILIDAVQMLPAETRARVSLEIVGEGDEQPALEEQARRLKVPAVFRPRIPHRDLLKRMGECAVYLQASDWEGHPKTVLEAMGAGAPVIVADAPGLGTVVQHGATGLRVARDAEAFSTAIHELINDEDWREMLGSAAARVTRDRLSLASILPQEVAVHQGALAWGSQRSATPRLAAG